MSYRGNPYCGGQGIYVYYIARELIKMGHEVHLIVGPPYPDEVEGLIIHKIENQNYFNNASDFINPEKPFASLSPLNFYEFLSSKFGIFPEIEAFSFRAFIKLRELVKKYKFDILHDNQCLGYGFLMIKSLGIPFISTIHHPLSIDRSTWFEYPSDFYLKIKRILYYPLVMQKIVSNRMDMIVTVSHDSAKEINKAFNVPMEKIRVVYNGLDPGIFRPMPSVKKKKNSLIFVGNVEDRKKGVIYLIKALGMIKNRAALTIVDGGTPARSLIPQMIEKFGVNGRVTFTGKIPVERLNSLYSESEIALSPSIYEGFGFPAAEAMACGLPLISADGGALPEVAGEHMKTAYIVPARDAGAIAAGIDYLMDNPRAREKMGKAAREHILKNFTWEKAGRMMMDVYWEAISAYRGI